MSESQDDTGADSIYRAPTSDTSVATGDDFLAAFVGPKNAHYYERIFANFEAGRGTVSWHWPAFFVSWFWLMYRKMWGWFFVYWFGIPIALTSISAMISTTAGAEAGLTFYYGGYVIIAFILVPMFANNLYYKHAKKKIEKVAASSLSGEQQRMELARMGGTSNVAFVLIPVLIFVAGILAAIAIPAYQDYTIRAQVSEGLNLSGGAKAAVSESYMDVGSFPADNQAAGLSDASSITGNYVSSLAVYDGSIVVTYGNNAHTVLTGRELVLEPQGLGSNVTWSCYSNDIADKHLPAACR